MPSDIDSLNTDLLPGISNPFTNECITAIDIHIPKNSCIGAMVSFRNGNTSGFHEIQAYSIEELNEKLISFIDTLPKQT